MNVISATMRKREGTMSASAHNSGTMQGAGYSFRTQTKTISPSDEMQEIFADEGYMLAEVIIEAIPSNYGHIAYNGGVLSVY